MSQTQSDPARKAIAAAQEAAALKSITKAMHDHSLFNKMKAINECSSNPFQPPIVWVPSFFGSMLQIDLRDEVSQSIFLHGAFEPELVWLLSHVLKPGDVFYDVGAHIGFFSVLAAGLVGEEGEVNAFEPTPATRTHLETNLRNAEAKQARVHSEAVWSSAGRVRFLDYGPGRSPFNSTKGDRSSKEDAHSGATELEVECVSLDSFFGAGRGRAPDLIKVDVESAESEVLSGMKELLKEHRPILTLEVGDFDALIAQGVKPSLELLKSIASEGYDLFTIEGMEFRRHELKVEPYAYMNIVCVPQERSESVSALFEAAPEGTSLGE